MISTLIRLHGAAIVLLAAIPCAMAATPEEFAALFKQYGFEYRDKAIRPWGVPISARLSQVRVGEDTVEIDRSSPLTRTGMQKAITTWLARHGANELQLISIMFSGPMGKIVIDPATVTTETLESVLIEPPFESFRVRIPTIEHEGVRFDPFCDFHFVALDGKYHQVYFETNYGNRRSREPGCNVSSSNARNYN